MVELDAPALVAVIRVVEPASLSLGQVMRRVRLALVIEVVQARLLAVRPQQPTQIMVERAVLHAQHDDVVEPALCRVRQLTRWHEAVRKSA